MNPKSPETVGSPKLVTEITENAQQMEYEKKLRRRVEDRIRKDREALYLVARVLNIG